MATPTTQNRDLTPEEQAHVDKVKAEIELDLARDSAIRELDATYAIMNLGDMLRCSIDNGGYEGITRHQWAAIGIAIQQLGHYLCEGSISKTYNEVVAQD